MKKSELKQLIQEVIQEEKFGRKRYFVTLTRDYKVPGLGTTYKKGQRVSVILGADGIPYIVAGHGLSIDFPPEVAKLSTVQSELPDELVRRMGDILKKLEVLTKNKSVYYSDVFTDEVAKKFVSKVEEKLKKFASTKSPIRK